MISPSLPGSRVYLPAGPVRGKFVEAAAMNDIYQPDPDNTAWVRASVEDPAFEPLAPEPEAADDDYYGSFCGNCHAELVGDEVDCPFCGEEWANA